MLNVDEWCKYMYLTASIVYKHKENNFSANTLKADEMLSTTVKMV